MFRKILAKLHLSNLAYKISMKCIGGGKNYKILNYERAIDLLHAYSKDVHGSCICEHEFKDADCDVEVIVPCYNVENYVQECITSILNQKTQYSFFITIVNDGSTDRTGEILKEYEGIDNIKVITQCNKGFSGARNAGIAQAHGRYLMFVDSDDILFENAIENLMLLADKTEADVVDSGHIRFADKTHRASLMARLYDKFQKPQILPYNEHSTWITGYPCGKIFKRSLFKSIEFPKGYWFEDTLVCMVIEPLCKIKSSSDKLSFGYRMNVNSISHTYGGNPKSLDGVYVTLQLLKDRNTMNIPICSIADYEMLLKQIITNHKRIMQLPKKIQNAAFIVHSELINTDFKVFEAKNELLKPVESFLREKNFLGFYVWCLWN